MILALLEDVGSVIVGLKDEADVLSGKSILLTGARGYLGRFVVATLLELNDDLPTPMHIYAMDSLLHGPDDREDWRNQPNLHFIQHDVCHEFGNLTGLLAGKKLDYVLHMAGIASPFWYNRLPLETISVSVDGSRNLLKLAREHQAKYLFTSSSEVYQTADVVPTPETYVGAVPSQSDRSCYDISKLMGETLAYVYGSKFDVHTNVVRIFNSFGVGLGEKDRRILARIASAVKVDRPVQIYRTREGPWPKRTYTPVANTVLGLLLVMLKGAKNETYNVGLNCPEVDVPTLCGRIEYATGLPIEVEFKDAPAVYQTEPMRRCPDITKLKGLGFVPIVDLDEGLRRFFKWAMKVYTGEA